MKESDT